MLQNAPLGSSGEHFLGQFKLRAPRGISHSPGSESNRELRGAPCGRSRGRSRLRSGGADRPRPD
eukprot:9377640-Alexandrium_andersonii.AAC.1